jgi:hypothetical protein
MRCACHVSFYFERSCPEQRPRAALKPQEQPHSSGPWTPGAPAEVLTGRGVVVVESWQAESCRSYLCCSREGGPHTSSTPGSPLSHDVNPRDGAQDIFRLRQMQHLLLDGTSMGSNVSRVALEIRRGRVQTPTSASASSANRARRPLRQASSCRQNTENGYCVCYPSHKSPGEVAAWPASTTRELVLYVESIQSNTPLFHIYGDSVLPR